MAETSISTGVDKDGAWSKFRVLTEGYQYVTLIAFVSAPLAFALYIAWIQNPPMVFKSFSTHHVFVGLSIFIGAFVTWVSFLCYRRSGEAILFFLTLSFMAFSIVYMPHGLLTMTAPYHAPLFLMFGPLSRLIMGAYFLLAMLHFAAKPHSLEKRRSLGHWLLWGSPILVMLAVEPIIAFPLVGVLHPIRITVEVLAIGLFFSALIPLFMGFRRSALFFHVVAAVILFGEAGATFIFAKPWTHLWWFCHIIFAAGFALLGYGIMQVYRSTGSFANVFIDEDALEKIVKERQLSLKRFSELADRLPILLLEWRDAGNGKPEFLFANRAAQSTLLCDSAATFDSEAIWASMQENVLKEDWEVFYSAFSPWDKHERNRTVHFRMARGASELRWYHADVSRAMAWDGGTMTRAIIMDITGLKEQELERQALDRQTSELRRYKSLSQLAGGLTHEINNMMQPVIMGVELISLEMPEDASYAQEVESIKRNCLRIKDLVSRTMGINKTGESTASTVFADKTVMQITQDLAHSLPENIKLTTQFNAGEVMIAFSETELQQVIGNLISNASYALQDGGGRISVETFSSTDRSGQYFELIVSDDGQGMTAECVSRAFDPFYTTKPVGKGTGLGLSLIKEIVESRAGNVSIQSTPAQGTSVRILVPVIGESHECQRAS